MEIVVIAIYSRVVVILAAILGTIFTSTYDSSPMLAPHLGCNMWVVYLTDPWVRWDAVYHLDIVLKSYQFEQQFAFFPAYPAMVHIARTMLFPKQFQICQAQAAIIAGLLISNFSFVLAAVVLHRLAIQLRLSPRISRTAAILFCINPASIFMSSLYTESLFALLSFYGMLNSELGHDFLSAVTFAIAACTRSNGIVYAGFFIWKLVSPYHHSSVMKKILLTAYALLVCVPFIVFQWVGYNFFCPDTALLWCSKSIPLIYSHVQSHYWDVGFLRYYTLQQLPNFILAIPLLIVGSYSIYSFVKANPLRFFTIGYINGNNKVKNYHLMMPYMYLLAFMLFMVTTMMHVQVVIRFFTPVPIIYFTVSTLMHGSISEKWWANIYLCYSILFAAIGVVLFVSFLPPA